MSGSTWESSPTCARSSGNEIVDHGPQFDAGFDGAEELLRAWCGGLTPDPDLTVSAWADKHRVLSSRGASEAGPWRTSRTPYLTRDHGRAVAVASVPAGRVHERFAGRRDRERRQLDRLRHSPRAGADAGGAAVGGAGQALLAAAHRSADRGKPGLKAEGGAVPIQGLRQHGAVEGVPRRHPGDDRRQHVRSVCARCRCATCSSTRSTPIRRRPTTRAIRWRSPKPGRGPSPGGARCSSPRRRRSRGCRGSSGNTRPRISGGSSCRARTAARSSISSSSGCAGRRASRRRRPITARAASSRSPSITRHRC